MKYPEEYFHFSFPLEETEDTDWIECQTEDSEVVVIGTSKVPLGESKMTLLL